jgi:hypothetical protein
MIPPDTAGRGAGTLFRRLLGSSVLIAALLSSAAAFASERYDPRLRFRSIRTEHFTIHFHQGGDRQAQRLARIAEEVHGTLSPMLQSGPRRHTHVILVDQHDEANGWATPLPFNTIEISASAPDPSGLLGHTDDWLRLVFTHEYVHILHLDRSRGIFGALRHVFGRAPMLFPNIYLPGWNVEGLATFHETMATGTGRLRAGAFRTIVDAAARGGEFVAIDRATGALVDWPGGHAAYAFGASFHEYLADRFGAESFGRLADVTAGRVPYLPGGAYDRVFGASAEELWNEFRTDVERRAIENGGARAEPDTKRLTREGYFVSGPRWLPDGAIVYTARTPHAFPSLMWLPPGDGEPRALVERYLGERAAVSGDYIYFDQRELSHSVALQGDLYVIHRRTGSVQRLTHGARAADPDVAPDGRSLVAIAQRHGAAPLVRFTIEQRGESVALADPSSIIDEADTQFGAPRWSPDGTRVAAERRRLGAVPHVAIVDVNSRAVLMRIEADEGRLGEPEWLDDGRLLVTWERPRQAPVICRVDLATGAALVVVATVNGARTTAVSPTGGRIAYVGYTPEGYDLFTAALPDTPSAPAALRLVRGDEAARQLDSTPLPIAPYRPSSMAPRFWMPVVQTDEDRLEVGAGTLGVDALGRHSYLATVRWSDRARPDWDVAYAYDRWRPTVFISASDDVTVWQEDDYRETSVDVGLTLPFRTVRRRQTLFGAFHATREQDPRSTFDRRSLRAGYQLSTARRYGYSISASEGIAAGAALDVTRRALGGDADAATLSVDLRAYPRLGGSHRVLAVRAAAAASWGEREGRRVLGAGGSAASGSTLAFGRDAIGLARGFDSDSIVGYRAAVLNVDYRVPLLTIERGIGRLPVFIRQLHGAVFVDAAHAWTSRFRAKDARASAGAELAADIVLGHYAPVTVAGGFAVRRDPSGAHDGAAVFARVGYAF